jgi:hypothetical protein
MERRSPYFVVPYDVVRSISLKSHTKLNRFEAISKTSLESNPFAEYFDVTFLLPNTLDSWKAAWSLDGLKEVFSVLKANAPEKKSEDFDFVLNRLERMIRKVEEIRTMHLMKHWGLQKTEKISGNFEDDVVDLDKLLEDVEKMKDSYKSQ